MKGLWARGWALTIVLGLLWCVAARADESTASEAAPKAADDWPLERLTLSDGRVLQGLVESEGPSSVEFIEVRRPAGKRMYLVVRPIDRGAISSLERISPAEQKQLRGRLEKYKQRAQIEGRRMEDLSLTSKRDEGGVVWEYRGNWFTLQSTAGEQMTRRAIVRLEQIFTAYRQLVTPRWQATQKVHIRMFGATEPYRHALGELGLEIKNPAVYLADKNLILAGSDMNRFDAELAQINRQHQQIRQQFDALVADTPNRLKKLGAELDDSGLSAAERQRILLAEQKKWEDQRKAARRKIQTLDRKNSARFNEVTLQMFTRLAHEAFHAYLETYVYPRRAYDVPRWLNEGLAQTFEGGLIEADRLRVDAPNAIALAALQDDLRGGSPLPLAELLSAPSDTFLSTHAATGAMQSRLYYYSWGLAYYLAIERGTLESDAFDAYLNPSAAKGNPIERFEQLVGMPLDEFQTQWREAMLNLKSTP